MNSLIHVAIISIVVLSTCENTHAKLEIEASFARNDSSFFHEIIKLAAHNDSCSTEEFPIDTRDDEDDLDRFCTGEHRVSAEDERNFCVRLIDGPLSRSEALKVARGMVELLQRPRLSSPGCRITPALNSAAQRLIQFVTQESYSFMNDDDQPVEATRKASADMEYCELYAIKSKRREIALNTQITIMRMVSANVSTKTIQAKYRWFRPSYIKNFNKCLLGGGNLPEKMNMVNDFVLEKVADARNRYLPIHDRNIQEWGLEISAALNITNYFKASRTWALDSFKHKYGITSRAITEYTSRIEQQQAEEIVATTRQFKQDLKNEVFYPRHLIWNEDQTPFNYEIVNKRTLSWRGERDHC